MNGKKRFTIGLCLLLIICMLVGGSLAYLNHTTDEVENTFTMGKVRGSLDEAKVDPDTGQKIEGGGRVVENEYKLVPNRTIDKDPTVHVEQGSEKCYVRVRVKVNELTKLQALLLKASRLGRIDFNDLDSDWWQGFVGGYNEELWDRMAIIIDEDEATIEYWYKFEVDATEAQQDLTLFETLKIPGWLDEDLLESFINQDGTMKGIITIEANLIQSEGFPLTGNDWNAQKHGMAAAWAAFEGGGLDAQDILARSNDVSALLPTAP